MSTTTAPAICNRAIAAVAALSPVSLRERFVAYRNEEGADFIKWAESNAEGALRRFQVRITGQRPAAVVSNTDFEEVLVDVVVLIAYPRNSRAGKLNALDRDRIMDEDANQIWQSIGMAGRANFSAANGYPDASWRGGRVEQRVPGKSCDYTRISLTLGFYRTMP